MAIKHLRAVAAWVGVVVLAGSLGAAGADASWGGRADGAVSALPSWGCGGALHAFVGWDGLELSSRTEGTCCPYTLADETLALSLTREWLSVAVEYTFSVLPIGITAAGFAAHAAPPPLQMACGALVLDVAVESEARLKGTGFASTPLRAELWIEGRVAASRSVACFDAVVLEVGVEETLSSPGGPVWPTPSVLVAASLGRVTMASETSMSLAPKPRVASERVSLSASWQEVGVRAEAWCLFSGEPRGPSAGLTVSYSFGDLPRRAFPGGTECVGGVCR